MNNEIKLNERLTPKQIISIAGGARMALSDQAWHRITYANELLHAIVDRGIRCYGVNTGVGAFCDTIVPLESQRALSRNIIMSHAVGIGQPLSSVETRAIMASAINNFSHGRSGVRPIVVRYLTELLNHGISPVVPREGSVGYISHMAHIALVLLGSGEATLGDELLPGSGALGRAGLAPLVLEAKEGLSLINGTPCVTGLAAVALERSRKMLDWADNIAAMTFENIGSQPDAFAPAAMFFRTSNGVKDTAVRLSRLTAGSQILGHAATRTQDAMSLRALPQVHGAVRDQLVAIGDVLDRELASATDNPILAGSVADPIVYSQAHPIGTAMALAMDGLSVAVAKIAAMSERRIDRLLNPLVSGLPGFLAASGGVSTGLMIAQYTALSLVSENRRLAAPASLDGGVSSALQEDEIPHAAPAALKAIRILDNLEAILGIELIAASQAYEFQKPASHRAPETEHLYRQFRACIAPYADDRPLGVDLLRAANYLRETSPTISSSLPT